MISMWIAILGWFVAGALGFFIAALLSSSKRADECANCQEWGHRIDSERVENKMVWLQDLAKSKSAKEGMK